ncbi:MAG TPA: sigma 54-interacting transcriptional regulator [Thermoanaerobaculia bacterium]|nr:sigma 54-interacting transcriptional regulator [Thermoanaerobaculia bacterium]
MSSGGRSRLGSPGPSLPLAALIAALEGCPTPALSIDPQGRVLAANAGARRRLGLKTSSCERPVRDLLGVGWRQLELVAAEGLSDLVVDLPLRPPGSAREGWRVRPERVLAEDGTAVAVVAYLEEPSPLAVAGSPHERRRAQAVDLDALFGEDPRVIATKQAAARFARTRLPILLLAETGTGKDLLARAIHALSPRCDRPFVAINCGALSPHLLESELFGYAPGAFTDARREGNEGKIGAARGGTLFLDEVAEMPGPLQALLLRVLEDGTYYRVGENLPRQADVRLICATCRDLPLMVEEGAFRQDLFYRIAGACLHLPPVRERSDLRDLVRHVLADLAAHDETAAGRTPRIAAEALDGMARQSWPGNVRQIKTALQYALTLAEGDEIRCEHLPPPLLSARGPQTAWPVAAPPPAEAAGPRTLAALEQDLVRRAVAEADGNLALAARRLGIARSTLYRFLRRTAGPPDSLLESSESSE